MAGITKGVVPKEGVALTEQFFGQVSESIQLVFDLTSRIDERVKMLIERQKEIDEQMEKLLIVQQNAINRLTALESKDFGSLRDDLHKLSEKIAIISSENSSKSIDDLQNRTRVMEVKLENLVMRVENLVMRVGNHDNRWGQIFDAVWKVVLMCITGYILYKLGLQAPSS